MIDRCYGSLQTFPGLLDKRDRLQTIDYDALSMNMSKKKVPSTGATGLGTHGTSLVRIHRSISIINLLFCIDK